MYNEYSERTLDHKVVDAQNTSRVASDGFYGDPVYSTSESPQTRRPRNAMMPDSAHIPHLVGLAGEPVINESSNISQSPVESPYRRPYHQDSHQYRSPVAISSPSYRASNSTARKDHASPANDWNDRGAATIVKSETDEEGNVSNHLVKKGVKDFEFGETLGEGSYSTVVAASDKQTLKEYAIKVLDKRHIIKEKKVKYVNIEKDTLNRLGDHPGIVRLYYTFQDEQSLYFVLDYASNGELLSLIKRTGSLNEECVRYFGSQLLDAIEFMHSRGVVHRDVKPENILLDHKMRIKVTDFGTAKLLSPAGKNDDGTVIYPADTRASSFVGTAEYLAPELLTLKYNGKACDIWAFGCIIYQMFAGRPPFKAANEYQTFQKIVKLQYSYPPGFPVVARDLIKRLLVLNPNDRLSIEQIKEHAFFSDIDWSRKSIWGATRPRIRPYKASTTGSNLMGLSNKLPGLRQLPAARTTPRTIGETITPRSKPASAATAAAAALSKSPHTIQQQVYQQQQDHILHHQQVQQAKAQAHQDAHQNDEEAQKNRKLQTTESTQPRTRHTASRQQSAPSLRNEAVRKKAIQTSTSSSTAVAPVKTVPKLILKADIKSDSNSHSPKTTSPITNSPKTPVDYLPPLGALPATPTDAEYSSLLLSHEERILRLDTLNVLATIPEDEQQNNAFSKLFTASRRKKRTVLITTAGRFLLAGVDDKRLKLELSLGNPQVIVREYPFNKKSQIGAISFEFQHKLFTIEDPKGTSGWMDAIEKARMYYKKSVALSHANAQTAMYAASLASGVSPKYPPVSSVPQHHSQSREINGSTSVFLQKNEARKVMRKVK